MDLSAPKGYSYNDAINDSDLEKVSMSSARLFGYSVQNCGVGARMWKFDMVDAFKKIPASQQDLRLQGFTWLGKFFIELKKVFGSREPVSAFDTLNNTLVTLAALHAHLPPHSSTALSTTCPLSLQPTLRRAKSSRKPTRASVPI